MPTLSLFKDKFFRVGKVVGIILAAILIIVILFKGIFAIKEWISPTPAPAPTVKFGKLPKINFPEGIKKSIEFSVDTVSGELPEFSDRATIYKMATYEPDLLAVEKATARIKEVGFNEKPEQLSENVYRWKTTIPFEKNLVLDTHFPDFALTSNFATNPAVLTAQNLPTEIEATEIAKSLINSLSLYPEDIDEEKTVAALYSLNQGVINPAPNISSTNLISVFFFQKDREELPIVYPGAKSTMSVTVGGGESEPEIVDARFLYQKVGKENATYPIKSAQEALDELKDKKGYIISLGKEEKVAIKKAYLAYYIGKQRQEYLLPVIVFEGTNEFAAYVSAVKDDWIQN